MAFNDGIYTISQYVESRCNLRDKIEAIDLLIASMELKMLDATGNADLDEYSLNDGQMTVRTKYRSVQDVQAGILGLEQLKQRYVNRLNGRITVLRSGRF